MPSKRHTYSVTWFLSLMLADDVFEDIGSHLDLGSVRPIEDSAKYTARYRSDALESPVVRYIRAGSVGVCSMEIRVTKLPWTTIVSLITWVELEQESFWRLCASLDRSLSCQIGECRGREESSRVGAADKVAFKMYGSASNTKERAQAPWRLLTRCWTIR